MSLLDYFSNKGSFAIQSSKNGADLLTFENGQLVRILGFPLSLRKEIIAAIRDNRLLGERTDGFLKALGVAKGSDISEKISTSQRQALLGALSGSNASDKYALIYGVIAAYAEENDFNFKANALEQLAKHYAANKKSQLAFYLYACQFKAWHSSSILNKGVHEQSILQETLKFLATIPAQEYANDHEFIVQLILAINSDDVFAKLVPAEDASKNEIENFRDFWVIAVESLSQELVKQKQSLLSEQEQEIARAMAGKNEIEARAARDVCIKEIQGRKLPETLQKTQQKLHALLNIAADFSSRLSENNRNIFLQTSDESNKTLAAFYLNYLKLTVSPLYVDAYPVLKQFKSPGSSDEEQYWFSQILADYYAILKEYFLRKGSGISKDLSMAICINAKCTATSKFVMPLPEDSPKKIIIQKIHSQQFKTAILNWVVLALEKNLGDLAQFNKKDFASSNAIALMASCIELYKMLDVEQRKQETVEASLERLIVYMKGAIDAAESDVILKPLFRQDFLPVPPGGASRGAQYRPNAIYVEFYKKFGRLGPAEMMKMSVDQEQESTDMWFWAQVLDPFKSSTFSDTVESFQPAEIGAIFSQNRREFAAILENPVAIKGDVPQRFVVKQDPNVAAILKALADDPTNSVHYEQLGRLFLEKQDYTCARMAFQWCTNCLPNPSSFAYLGLMQIDEIAYAKQLWQQKSSADEEYGTIRKKVLDVYEQEKVNIPYDLVPIFDFYVAGDKSKKRLEDLDPSQADAFALYLEEDQSAFVKAVGNLFAAISKVEAIQKYPQPDPGIRCGESYKNKNQFATQAMLVLLHPQATTEQKQEAYAFLKTLNDSFELLGESNGDYAKAVFELKPWSELLGGNTPLLDIYNTLRNQNIPKVIHERVAQLRQEKIAQLKQELIKQILIFDPSVQSTDNLDLDGLAMLLVSLQEKFIDQMVALDPSANKEDLQQLSAEGLKERYEATYREQQELLGEIQKVDESVSVDRSDLTKLRESVANLQNRYIQEVEQVLGSSINIDELKKLTLTKLKEHRDSLYQQRQESLAEVKMLGGPSYREEDFFSKTLPELTSYLQDQKEKLIHDLTSKKDNENLQFTKEELAGLTVKELQDVKLVLETSARRHRELNAELQALPKLPFDQNLNQLPPAEVVALHARLMKKLLAMMPKEKEQALTKKLEDATIQQMLKIWDEFVETLERRTFLAAQLAKLTNIVHGTVVEKKQQNEWAKFEVKELEEKIKVLRNTLIGKINQFVGVADEGKTLVDLPLEALEEKYKEVLLSKIIALDGSDETKKIVVRAWSIAKLKEEYDRLYQAQKYLLDRYETIDPKASKEVLSALSIQSLAHQLVAVIVAKMTELDSATPIAKNIPAEPTLENVYQLDRQLHELIKQQQTLIVEIEKLAPKSVKEEAKTIPALSKQLQELRENLKTKLVSEIRELDVNAEIKDSVGEFEEQRKALEGQLLTLKNKKGALIAQLNSLHAAAENSESGHRLEDLSLLPIPALEEKIEKSLKEVLIFKITKIEKLDDNGIGKIKSLSRELLESRLKASENKYKELITKITSIEQLDIAKSHELNKLSIEELEERYKKALLASVAVMVGLDVEVASSVEKLAKALREYLPVSVLVLGDGEKGELEILESQHKKILAYQQALVDMLTAFYSNSEKEIQSQNLLIKELMVEWQEALVIKIVKFIGLDTSIIKWSHARLRTLQEKLPIEVVVLDSDAKSVASQVEILSKQLEKLQQYQQSLIQKIDQFITGLSKEVLLINWSTSARKEELEKVLITIQKSHQRREVTVINGVKKTMLSAWSVKDLEETLKIIFLIRIADLEVGAKKNEREAIFKTFGSWPVEMLMAKFTWLSGEHTRLITELDYLGVGRKEVMMDWTIAFLKWKLETVSSEGLSADEKQRVASLKSSQEELKEKYTSILIAKIKLNPNIDSVSQNEELHCQSIVDLEKTFNLQQVELGGEWIKARQALMNDAMSLATANFSTEEIKELLLENYDNDQLIQWIKDERFELIENLSSVGIAINSESIEKLLKLSVDEFLAACRTLLVEKVLYFTQALKDDVIVQELGDGVTSYIKGEDEKLQKFNIWILLNVCYKLSTAYVAEGAKELPNGLAQNFQASNEDEVVEVQQQPPLPNIDNQQNATTASLNDSSEAATIPDATVPLASPAVMIPGVSEEIQAQGSDKDKASAEKEGEAVEASRPQPPEDIPPLPNIHDQQNATLSPSASAASLRDPSEPPTTAETTVSFPQVPEISPPRFVYKNDENERVRRVADEPPPPTSSSEGNKAASAAHRERHARKLKNKEVIINDMRQFLSPQIMAALQTQENLSAMPTKGLIEIRETLQYIANSLKESFPEQQTIAEFDKLLSDSTGEPIGSILLKIFEARIKLAQRAEDVVIEQKEVQKIQEITDKIAALDVFLNLKIDRSSYENKTLAQLTVSLSEKEMSLVDKITRGISQLIHIKDETILQALAKSFTAPTTAKISFAQLQLACALQQYIFDRSVEQARTGKDHHTFFGIKKGIPAGEKIAAAEKVIKHIFSGDVAPLSLTATDSQAFAKGDLGAIRSEFKTAFSELENTRVLTQPTISLSPPPTR